MITFLKLRDFVTHAVIVSFFDSVGRTFFQKPFMRIYRVHLCVDLEKSPGI